MKRKLKNGNGFTIVEMLCTVLILAMLCLLMCTGLNMAVKSYHDITAESETQLLLSSLSDALSDKLRYAVVTETAGVTECSVGEIKCAGGRVVVEEKKSDGTTSNKALLPEGAYGNGRYEAVTADVSSTVSSGVVTFTVSLKVKETLGEIGAEAEFTVRCLNPLK